MKKVFLLAATIILAFSSATAQVDRNAFRQHQEQIREQYRQQRDQARQQYNDARKKAEEEYAAFRKKANEDYAAAMERAWQRMGVLPAEPKPAEPAPPPPQKPAPNRKFTTEPLPQSEIVLLPKPAPPLPAPPIPVPLPEEPKMDFAVYGSQCQVHTGFEDLRFKLASVDERGAAETWKTLSEKNYDALLHDCLSQRDEMHIGDWGYVRLIQAATEKLLGKGSNEAVLLQVYLLTQSGYRVRLAKAEGEFILLVPFSRSVFGYLRIEIDGIYHYLITKKELSSISVCNVGYPREQVANIQLDGLPLLKGKTQPKRTFTAARFGTMKAEVGVNKCLIDFMNDYPVSNAWDCYALAGLSDEVKRDLYPALRSQIEGKSKKKAANMLLDFVQSAFDYATDQEQFGYERPLFGDESFFYPQNDCEDRSILYSILVRDLLGLDVVLIDYPRHIATAVAFPEEVEGDYYTVDGRRFTVCDPTYEGADIGEAMPQYKGVKAKIVKL